VVPLLSVLFNDQDRAVREDAVRALGQIGDARAVEFLVTVMKEPGLQPWPLRRWAGSVIAAQCRF